MFQSHNGAIAADGMTGVTICCDEFQSHNGAIAAAHTSPRPEFFTHVSIPQWCDCCFRISFPWFAGNYRFQSHNGAIAARTVKEFNVAERQVSIPQWCDCC